MWRDSLQSTLYGEKEHDEMSTTRRLSRTKNLGRRWDGGHQFVPTHLVSAGLWESVGCKCLYIVVRCQRGTHATCTSLRSLCPLPFSFYRHVEFVIDARHFTLSDAMQDLSTGKCQESWLPTIVKHAIWPQHCGETIQHETKQCMIIMIISISLEDALRAAL